MSFNINKCEVIQKIPFNQLITYVYGHQLKQVTEAKYLGVTLDSKLKHIDVICKKANTMLSFIRRNLHTQLIYVKSQAYRMYIRPLLEYSSTVFGPLILNIALTSLKQFKGGQLDMLWTIIDITVVYHQ